jgi:hypothetical protein
LLIAGDLELVPIKTTIEKFKCLHRPLEKDKVNENYAACTKCLKVLTTKRNNTKAMEVHVECDRHNDNNQINLNQSVLNQQQLKLGHWVKKEKTVFTKYKTKAAELLVKSILKNSLPLTL